MLQMQQRSRLLWIGALLLVAYTSDARALPATSACGEIKEAIETSFKAIAMTTAKAMGDESVPRATLAELEKQTRLQSVGLLLQQMRDNGCTPLSEPLVIGRYLVEALECQTDLKKIQLGQTVPMLPFDPVPASCEVSQWKPMGREALTK